MPDLRTSGFERIVVVNLSLEFVMTNAVPPPRGRTLREKQGASEQPQGGPSSSRTMQIVYEPSMLERLPDELYVMFVRELERHQLQVLPAAVVRAARAYQDLKTVNAPQTLLFRFGQNRPFGFGTGWPKKVSTYPVAGLGTVKGTRGRPIEQLEQELLGEIGADMAIHVRLRFGVYGGRAVMERGSNIALRSRHRSGIVSLGRPLVCNGCVLVDDDLGAARGNVYRVDGEKYRAVIRKRLPAVFALAFDTHREPVIP